MMTVSMSLLIEASVWYSFYDGSQGVQLISAFCSNILSEGKNAIAIFEILQENHFGFEFILHVSLIS